MQTELGARCTGALVGPRLVLTAARCLRGRGGAGMVRPESVHFLLGYHLGGWTAHARVAAFATGAGFTPHPVRPGTRWRCCAGRCRRTRRSCWPDISRTGRRCCSPARAAGSSASSAARRGKACWCTTAPARAAAPSRPARSDRCRTGRADGGEGGARLPARIGARIGDLLGRPRRAHRADAAAGGEQRRGRGQQHRRRERRRPAPARRRHHASRSFHSAAMRATFAGAVPP
ncbi:hypothetical protein K1J50_09175 [Caldovatus sp. SYSU G05006]|uniref:Peptidase S1 domain-containing protein n=1 Tax=Caldovatus aquaticus TaxID=2865671 RepID=A0ABS7F207_9PROT|nr:hypothetical protein [Caldovatus aquaticus]